MENESANGAGSPAAIAESPAALTLQVPSDDAAYAEWRLSGKLPDKKSEESGTSPSAEGVEPKEKAAPAPEAGEKRQERKRDAADRLQEILSDLKRAGLTPSELKSFKRETQQQAKAKPPEITVNPPQPAKQAPLKRPVLGDFKTWEEFETARESYFEQRTRQEVQRGISEYIAQQAQQQANQTAAQKLQEAKQRYGEEAESSIVSAAETIFSDQEINPAIKAIINDSPVVADLLYVMGSKTEDFNDFVRLSKTNPLQAIRKAVLLEQLVTEELKKNGGDQDRDESGKFKAPVKRVSEAPPPAREVSGKASPPPDEVSSAWQRNDFGAYRAAANRRDLTLRHGR